MTQLKKSQRLKIEKKKKKLFQFFYSISFLPIADGGLVVVSEGVVKLVELELDLLMEVLKEKDCAAGVSNAENLKKVIL